MLILRNLAVFALSQKALRFSRFLKNLCSSLALPKIFALFAFCQKIFALLSKSLRFPSFSQRPRACIKILTLSQNMR
jgi:hypothetical protein